MGGTYWSLSQPGMPPFPGNMIGANVWQMSDGSFLLDDLNFDYNSVSAASTQLTAMDSETSGPPGFDDTTTNSYTPNGLTNGIPVNYGTNLWIAQSAVGSGYFTGIGSNTISGVYYVIQSVTNLLEGSNGWQYEGTILGSYATNWTPLSVPQYNRQNLFIRLASQQSSDGSSIPDWWEALYGLTNGVDPNAQDSAGDGYTIYQKYVFGLNPNSWLTPAEPSPVTVAFLPTANQANVQWAASAGNVVGYQVEKNYEATFGDGETYIYSTSDYIVSSNTLSILNDVSAETSDEDFVYPAFNDYFKVRAKYSNGQYSPWSSDQPLKTSYLSASLVYGANGQAYLAVSGVPQNTVKIRLFYYDYDAVNAYSEPPINFSNDIPCTSFTNGLYALPDSLQPPAQDSYGPAVYGYDVFVQTVDASNNPAGDVDLFLGTSWKKPFYDGRVQLKQNLIFKLRAAGTDKPFKFYYFDSVYDHDYRYEFSDPPTNHVEASILHVTDSLYDTNYLNPDDYYTFHSTLLDPQYPFFENYIFYNFAYNSANVTSAGFLDTGVGNENGTDLALSDTPLWKFQAPSGTWTDAAGLLDSTHTTWICSIPLDNSSLFSLNGQLGENNVSDNGGAYTLASNAKNLYGLAFSKEKLAGQAGGNNISLNLSPGATSPQYSFTAGPVLYAGTNQPQLQTVEYDFWSAVPVYNAILGRYTEYWLPGSHYFSPTSQSQQFFVPVGTSVSIAGYAKMTLQNGYSGVYAYLGQYFDKAYKVDTNGLATTNATGVLSPYGDFFATEAGRAALVTLPDPDTGMRGTDIVYCVSLQVDKNHDGVMDSSFSGADATSQASPMEFWVNNGNDQPNTTIQGGLDYDSPVPPAPPNYAPQTLSGGLAAYLYGHITCQRDLENFARLWISGIPALTANYQVTLSWTNANANPAINLFNSVETNGGVGYLTSTNIAARQITATATGQWMQGVAFSGPGVGIATITPSSSYTFPRSYFSTNTGNNYFLFEGAGIGSGELVLTISDQNNNLVAQTGVWLDLHDVKDFYEGMRITNSYTSAISNWNSFIQSVRLASANALGTDTNMIVWVHGINVPFWNWLDAGDTIFKRLYWAGYGGKFMAAGWPCLQSLQTIDFNSSELHAYKASFGLTNYFAQLRTRFPGYRLNVLAHSQGNAIVGEAVREGANLDTYILTQGAMGAGCYDVNFTIYPLLASQESYVHTPQLKPMGYIGIYTNFTGHLVNFYNFYDPVLDIWLANQLQLKPNEYLFNGGNYRYDGTNSYHLIENGPTLLVTDPQESRAMVSRSLTLPIGQSGPTTQHGVISAGVDLNASFGFYKTSFDDHSAQWAWPIQRTLPYYQQVLLSITPIQ